MSSIALKSRNGSTIISLWKNNVAWDVVLQEVREYIEEAKVLGLRIKWMSTGRRFMQALQRDNRMCFELMPFKKGGPDPQDCILHLEELVGVIEANVAESQEASKAKKNAMIAQVLAAQLMRIPKQHGIVLCEMIVSRPCLCSAG